MRSRHWLAKTSDVGEDAAVGSQRCVVAVQVVADGVRVDSELAAEGLDGGASQVGRDQLQDLLGFEAVLDLQGSGW